ncbi:MAG: trigger factor [Chlorobiaceae bacterium]|nr:trigger factor [Chlorobiaceae bacterium]
MTRKDFLGRMEITITDKTSVEKEILIIADKSELAPHIEEAYKRYQPKIEIKGFRKGKAPLHLIKSMHGESIEYSELDTIASDIYRQVIKDRDIHPIGEPALIDVDYKPGENLSFKVKYEIKPVFELQQYTGIPIEKIKHTVSQKEIDEEITRIRKANHTTVEAQKATDSEHILMTDIQPVDESGTPIIGKKTTDTKIYLASESLYPEIRDALIGCSVGETKKVKIEREHEDHKHTENLEITVKKIDQIVPAELTDELVKKVTKDKVATVQDFTSQIKKDIENYWIENSDRKFADNLINELVKKHTFDVPESLVKSILDSFVEELKYQYPNKTLPQSFDEKKYREENREYALFQAKWFLIREQIIEKEKLKVEDADLDLQAEKEAGKVGIDKARLIEFYKTSNSVQERILTDKLMATLKNSAVVTEKIID